MANKFINGLILFLGCEFICFSLLSYLHQTILKGDIGIIALYEENYSIPHSLAFYAPILIGIGLILYFLNKNGKVNFLMPFVPILAAFYLIFDAKNKMEPIAFDYYFVYTYMPYLGWLAVLWGVVFGLHKAITSLVPKEE
jgi:hypothetical protein